MNILNLQEINCILSREQNLRKLAELLYICLTTPDEVEYDEMMQSSSSDNCICHFNIKIESFRSRIETD